MSGPRETEVLVVGAGPTGLMAANWLVKLGVSCIVVDAKAGPTVESRALAVQARTMEVYDQLGLVDTVLNGAVEANGFSPGFRDRSFATIKFRRLGSALTRFSGFYIFEQSKNERMLADNLVRLGGEILWNHTIRGLENDGPGVVATLVDATGVQRTVRARYLIAADGASSPVRGLRGIRFEGSTYDHTFFVEDATDVEGVDLHVVSVRFAPDDILLCFPMGGTSARIVGIARDDPEGTPASAADAALRTRFADAFGLRWGASNWRSAYRVHHRVADRFRDGAVFLAGDAAHVHSPVGAQGMNTGLQDAHNLALKLVDVLRHRAPDSYLDRYEAERRPVALRLVASTDRAFAIVTSKTRRADLIRGHAIPVIMPIVAKVLPRFPVGRRMFGYIAQIRIHYWMSEGAKAASRGHRGAVVGRRLPPVALNHVELRSATWQVHAYGRTDAVALRALGFRLGIDVHQFAVRDPRPLRVGLWYLIRPDGFVAAEASPATADETFRRALPFPTPLETVPPSD